VVAVSFYKYIIKMSEAKIKSINEIISSSLVDIFVNKIFNTIEDSGDRKKSYHDAVIKFNTLLIRDVKSYDMVIDTIHTLFKSSTKHNNISFDEFVNIIVSTIIPEDLFETSNHSQKQEFLTHLITGSISDLSQVILLPENINKIFVRDSAFCISLKGTTSEILNNRKLLIKNKFLSKETNPIEISNSNKLELAVKKLTKQVAEEINKNKKIMAELIKYKQMSTEFESIESSYKADILKFKQNEVKYRKMIKLMQATTLESKIKLNNESKNIINEIPENKVSSSRLIKDDDIPENEYTRPANNKREDVIIENHKANIATELDNRNKKPEKFVSSNILDGILTHSKNLSKPADETFSEKIEVLNTDAEVDSSESSDDDLYNDE
jgi:hypothetical protein